MHKERGRHGELPVLCFRFTCAYLIASYCKCKFSYYLNFIFLIILKLLRNRIKHCKIKNFGITLVAAMFYSITLKAPKSYNNSYIARYYNVKIFA